MTQSGNLARDAASHAAALASELRPHDLKSAILTFANRPAPSAATMGYRDVISDCTLTFASANYGAIAVGGGTHFVPVVWLIG